MIKLFFIISLKGNIKIPTFKWCASKSAVTAKKSTKFFLDDLYKNIAKTFFKQTSQKQPIFLAGANSKTYLLFFALF